MASPAPWVLDKLAELVKDGLNCENAAAQLRLLGVSATPRQVRRWKEKHKILRGQRAVSDGELDAAVTQLHAAGELGDDEGYRWVHSIVNQRLAPRSVGEKRVCKSLRRLFPAAVEERKQIVEKRLIRRVYTAHYYGQASHHDLNCKATLPGGVKLFIFANVRVPFKRACSLPVTCPCP